jgi:hypothetical protein
VNSLLLVCNSSRQMNYMRWNRVGMAWEGEVRMRNLSVMDGRSSPRRTAELATG